MQILSPIKELEILRKASLLEKGEHAFFCNEIGLLHVSVFGLPKQSDFFSDSLG